MNKKFLIGLGVLVLLLGCAPQKAAEQANASSDTALVDEITSSEAEVEKLTQDLVVEENALDAELSRIESLELG